VVSRYGLAPERVARIFNPVDTSRLQPGDRAAARRALDIPASARVVAWHGRVEIEKKGLDVLLDAWGRMTSRGRVLALLGDGADAPALADRVDGLNDVRWEARYELDKDAVGRWLAAADVYAFPSRVEGFPVAPLEAMACGLPVVAADAHGVRDIFAGGEADGGVVVGRDDPVALADALDGVVGDRRRARALGRRARKRAEDAFSLPAVGAALRAFLLREPTAEFAP
jgi:starch synthase